MVAMAPQRNQNSAAGAITLLIAGFCSSGIFGMLGIWTKLKYQSMADPHDAADDVQPAEDEREPGMAEGRRADRRRDDDDDDRGQHETGDHRVP